MNFLSKILSKAQLISYIKQKKSEGKKIVFTNGCFDVFHYGHLQLLNEAQKFGNILIVGLNSDSSVRQLKGKNRPINNETHRAALLAALEIVDVVVIFDEDTPENLIHQIAPDVLVKGGDYAVDQIAGATFVLQNGGEVKIVPLVKDLSSSKILSLLKRD